MSLIDEALKRARQEAALQDAAQREAQFRRVPVYSPQPARSRQGLAMAGAGIGVGLALALTLAWAAGWIPSGRDWGGAAPHATELQAAAEPGPAAALPAPAPETVPETAPEAVPERQSPAEPPVVAPPPVRVTAPPSPVPVEREAPVATAPTPEPAPAPSAATPAAPSPVQEAPAAAALQPEERSYVRQVPVPGGGSLELNGIAYSSEQPVALLNGRPVVPGEVVEGFTVVAIEPKRVQLDGHGLKVFVSLR